MKAYQVIEFGAPIEPRILEIRYRPAGKSSLMFQAAGSATPTLTFIRGTSAWAGTQSSR
jgi:hypothetical protein